MIAFNRNSVHRMTYNPYCVPSDLIFLGLTAAFHISDHDTLLGLLKYMFCSSCVTLKWFGLYLVNRCQSIKSGSVACDPSTLNYWVPQKLILVPI